LKASDRASELLDRIKSTQLTNASETYAYLLE